jgi:seryl-tRNA synthetase
VHTINGTAVTSGRTLIAILENNQMSDGQVRLPKALADIYGEELL